MERDKKKHETSKEFVEKYWPAIAVGATVVGATVWLVARYIKEKKSRNRDEVEVLTQLEHEALSTLDETSILLETGAQLTKIAGDEIAAASGDLSPHLDNDKAKSTLEVLNNFAEMNSNGKKKK